MVRKLHAGLGGGPNLDSVRLTVEEKYYFTPVLTCPDLSGPTHNTVTMYARLAMSFFALSNALILQSYVLSWWNCKTRVILRTFNVAKRIARKTIEVSTLYLCGEKTLPIRKPSSILTCSHFLQAWQKVKLLFLDNSLSYFQQATWRCIACLCSHTRSEK